MENVSKALIMAASIILGVLLLSMMVYIFRAGAKIDENYDATQAERQLQLFNSKFEVYDKNDNNIIDIVTVANLAYSINIDYDYDFAKSIEVIVKVKNKYFVIPNSKNKISEDENSKYSRNKILDVGSSATGNGKPISIYNLIDTSLGDLLGDGSTDENDKLSLTRLGKIYEKDESGNPVLDENNKPIIDKNNATIYKYLFKCKCVCGNCTDPNGISYNTATGRVSKIEFEMFLNDEF